MQRNVWNDIVIQRTRRFNNSTKYLHHASMTTTSKKKKWNLWENCQKYPLKVFWNAHTWHVLDDLIFYGRWINLHDRSQNGPKPVANDYLVWSLTFITHVIANNIVMWETLPNNADWDCFKTPLLQEIMRIQNLHQVEHCAFLGSHTLVARSWMCKKQTSVSHSSTESEIISLDGGLRLDGILALDLIVAVLGNTNQSHKERGDLCTNLRQVRSTPHPLQKRKQSQGVINDMDNVDFIPSNVNSSHQEALLFVFEDNEAVIKMIFKGRSPTMRHVSRTHRVALDWLFDRTNLDPKIQVKYIDTKNQFADILTKGNFTLDEWNHLLCLFNISQTLWPEICKDVWCVETQSEAKRVSRET